MVVKKDAKAIGYFITLILIVYISSATFFIYPTQNPSLTIRQIIEVSGFALMYIVARVFYGNPFKARCSSSYLDELMHVLALMGFGSILSVIVWFMLFGFNMDINTIYLQAKLAFVNSWNVHLPIFALIFQGINGLVVAYFYHSVTYELFEKRNKVEQELQQHCLFSIITLLFSPIIGIQGILYFLVLSLHILMLIGIHWLYSPLI